ncbi:MAG: uroporphyrinogen-III synthase [Terriglobales bacterium]
MSHAAKPGEFLKELKTLHPKSKIPKFGLPLIGRRILVSRAKAQAGDLSRRLRALGATVLEVPFIEIRRPRSFKPLDNALRRHTDYQWLILTSANGVNSLFERLEKLGIRSEELGHLRIAAIGPATRAAIERRGLRVDIMPKEYVAESVVDRLRARVKGKIVLLVRARVARDVIPSELRKAGAEVRVVEAYETVVPHASKSRLLAALKSNNRRPHVITFTSSSTATNFLKLIGANAAYSGLLDEIVLASIGPVTTATLQRLNLPATLEAKEYNIPGLVKAISAHFCTQPSLP